MERSDSHTPLLTVEDVLGWVRERETVKAELVELTSRLSGLETRLRFASMLMPSEKAAQLIGDLGEAPDPSGAKALAAPAPAKRPKIRRRSIADGVLDALVDEKGGRAPSWVRDSVARDADLQSSVTSHSISNVLSRLYDRGQLIREKGLYYLPSLWEAIQSGDIVEEPADSLASNDAPTFTSRMTAVAASIGGPFDAAVLKTAAMVVPELNEKIATNSNSVNSWLSRQVDRGNPVREGKFYRLTSERDGAPTADAGSAPTAGEGATSSNKSGGDFNDLLR